MAIEVIPGWMAQLDGMALAGYEIHAGISELGAGCVPFLRLDGQSEPGGVMNRAGNVMGTYLHGIFDTGALWRAVVNRVRHIRGMDERSGETMTMAQFREREFDRLADIVRANIDMDAVYAILRGEDVPCGRWKA